MQLFMQDDGLAEAEEEARADLRKHLRVHFAAGDPSATGKCGLVSVLQRGLCAYATWYSAVSKVTAGKEPCGSVLQLNRLVRRVQTGATPPILLHYTPTRCLHPRSCRRVRRPVCLYPWRTSSCSLTADSGGSVWHIAVSDVELFLKRGRFDRMRGIQDESACAYVPTVHFELNLHQGSGAGCATADVLRGVQSRLHSGPSRTGYLLRRRCLPWPRPPQSQRHHRQTHSKPPAQLRPPQPNCGLRLMAPPACQPAKAVRPRLTTSRVATRSRSRGGRRSRGRSSSAWRPCRACSRRSSGWPLKTR